MSVRRTVPFWIIVLMLLAAFCFACVMAGCTPRVPFTPPPVSHSPFAATGNAEAELQSLFTWAVAISLFGVGACIAAAVFLASVIPSLAKWSVMGAAGFGSVFLLAMLAKVTLPFLPWIGLGLLGVGICLGIFYLRNHPEIFRLKSQLMQQSLTVGTPPVEITK